MEHLKRNYPKRAEEKKEKKDDSGADNKRADVKGGQIHTMFTSLVDVQSEIDFRELGEDDEFTWHQNGHTQRHQVGSAPNTAPPQQSVDGGPDCEPKNAGKYQEGVGQRRYTGIL